VQDELDNNISIHNMQAQTHPLGFFLFYTSHYK
jgi:hypothetical protein